MVIDPEHGTIDSPMHPSQVQIFPFIPEVLAKLCSMEFGLAIVTNQPAAAKGKTTHKNLLSAHEKVVTLVEEKGAKILSSHICFHRAEDLCSCRKPKTGLLEDAFNSNPTYSREGSWMIGDGVTDIQAGKALGLNTAFIGSKKWDIRRVFADADLEPTLWVENLKEFLEIITHQ